MNRPNQTEFIHFLKEGRKDSTRSQVARLINGDNAIKAYLDGKWDGGLGGLFELWAASEKSRKKAVSTQGKPDIYVKIARDGKITYQPAECKINGGRITSLRKAGAPRYVIIAMALDNSIASTIVYPKIVKTVDLLELLDSINGTKSTNGSHPEEAIQPSKRPLWRWLEEQADYYPDTVYTEELEEA